MSNDCMIPCFLLISSFMLYCPYSFIHFWIKAICAMNCIHETKSEFSCQTWFFLVFFFLTFKGVTFKTVNCRLHFCRDIFYICVTRIGKIYHEIKWKSMFQYLWMKYINSKKRPEFFTQTHIYIWVIRWFGDSTQLGHFHDRDEETKNHIRSF